MFTKIRGPDHHFSAFYEDNTILIQFILEEFVRSYQLIFQIKKLIQEQSEQDQPLDTLSLALTQNLEQLIGHLSQQKHLSFSRWTKGHLTKFKEYCEQFSLNSSYQHKEHINLHMAAHQAWLVALNNLEQLKSGHLSPYVPKSASILFLQPLKRSFHELQMRFNQISRYIPRIINPYWNNENVILCLLRRRDLLSEIYGSDFLYKRFKWPMKMSELTEFILTRYQERGFDALLPTIQYFLEPQKLGLNAH